MPESNFTIEKTICYIGNDQSYWNSITGRFETYYAETDFNFQRLCNENNNESENITNINYHFLQLINLAPCIIYIDLSSDKINGLKLIDLIKSEYQLKHKALVALVEDSDNVKQYCNEKVDFVHVKCGEQYDVVYDPFVLYFPNEAKKPDFAQAKFIKPITISESFRIATISKKAITIETDLKLEKGSEIELETEIPKKTVLSNKFIVNEQRTNNLRYPYYRYAYDLDFILIEMPKKEEAQKKEESSKEEGDKEDKAFDPQIAEMIYKEKMASYKGDMDAAKIRLKRWVDDKLDLSTAQKYRILVIDPTFSFFKNNKTIYDYSNFEIICTSSLTEEDLDFVLSFKPQMVVIQLNDPPPESDEPLIDETKKNEKNNDQELEQVSNILQQVKKDEKYNPFLLIFNSIKFSSQAFQDSFRYNLILANTNKLSTNNVIHLATMSKDKQEAKLSNAIKSKIANLRKKDPLKYSRLTPNDFQDHKYHIKISNKLSTVLYSHQIELITMTESEISFTSEEEILSKLLQLSFPANILVTIIPIDDKPYLKEGTKFTYKALLHAIGEEEKKKIRQFVNEIFFTTLSEQQQKEAEDFKQLNQDVQAQIEKEAEMQDEDKEIKEDDDS